MKRRRRNGQRERFGVFKQRSHKQKDKKSKSIEDHALEAARLVREKREIKKEIDSVRKEVPSQVAEARVTNVPDMVEREYSSYAMTDEEFRKFREKEMEQRRKKFV